MSTHPVASPPRDGSAAVRSDLRHLEKVRGIFASLAKFMNAQAIYRSNNPNFINSARAFEAACRAYFENEPELVLTVNQYDIVWREQVVYDIGPSTESIAFLLYKDGIGEISLLPGVGRDELEQLAGILTGALYNPSTYFDTATAFWKAEFPNICYRVLDEQTDGGGGDGEGSGNANREQPLRANDHFDIAADDAPGSSLKHENDETLDTLGWHFETLLGRQSPALQANEKEARLQQMIADELRVAPDAIIDWTDGPRSGHPGDELIAFLRIILDFTRVHCTPPAARDVNDTIERVVHYIRDEGHVSTLTGTLELVSGIDVASLDESFAPLPVRIRNELTDSAYLLSLTNGTRPGNSADDVLRYLALAGKPAMAAVRELLMRSSDASVHEKGCEVLARIAGEDLPTLVDGLDIENALLATDAMRLISLAPAPSLPPVVHRILSSREPMVRRCAIDYLVFAGSDDAARSLCTLFKDENPGVRMRAFAAAAGFAHTIIAEEVGALCFADDTLQRSSEEIEHMFRALGKVSGSAALPRLRQLVEKKHYLSSGKARSKRAKLAAITALRHIPGEDARAVMEKLCADRDHLVRTKAQHALTHGAGVGSDVYPRTTGVNSDEEKGA